MQKSTVILNLAGYKFTPIHELESLRTLLHDQCAERALKGTILLSNEGININLAGEVAALLSFKDYLHSDQRFQDISFHESYSANCPFKRLKVKIKDEIITIRHDAATPTFTRAPEIDPCEFKKWLDENRDITILDTRNEYEVRFGTFKNAEHLAIADFNEFPQACVSVDKHKPIVMFCTGGIRCEKAAVYMLNQGYENVYQLDGGILGYFAKAGGAHYEGECFVFDERVAVNSALKTTGTVQCKNCHGPVTLSEQQSVAYVPGVSCPHCLNG